MMPAVVLVTTSSRSSEKVPIMMPLTNMAKSPTVAPPACAISSRKVTPTGVQKDFGSRTAPQTETNFSVTGISAFGLMDVV